MDILKVLSRGTKKMTKSAPPGSNAAAKLPSAGSKTNPQLFHDEFRGMKRKRNPEDSPSDSLDDLLPEVDFFAPKDAPASSKAKQSRREDSPAANGASKQQQQQQLDEDECRRFLRSHRLKITLLLRHDDLHKVTKAKGDKKKDKKDKKDRKNKKEREEEEEKKDAKKDGKQQLFPQPLESFAQLRETYGISRRVAENLVFQGYRVPTEVQLGSLPLLIRPDLALAAGQEEGGCRFERGVDFLAVAPTGSGKTISFLIPTINNIMRRRAGAGAGAGTEAETGKQGVHELEAVVIVPTRELAHQTVNVGNQLLKGTGLRIQAMKKGVMLAAEQQKVGEEDDSDEEAEQSDEENEDEEEDKDEGEDEDEEDEDEDEDEDEEGHESQENGQRGKEEKGKDKSKKQRATAKVDILVTTPHLLLNFLTSGPASTQRVLPTVRNLILDEADVLLDPIFREQTMGIWTACNNTDLQLSFWSATMGSNIESLVTEKLQARNESLPGSTTPRPLVRLVVGLKDTAVPHIVHKLTYTASEQGKLLALRQLLRPTSGADSGPPLRPPFLVFTQTIERASALHEELKYDIPLEAGGPSRIAALHSSLPDAARAAIMRKFRAGEIWVLITTDVLARGVDFAGVNGVVNYDVPGSAAAYVHRAGRTGRAGREGGVAVTFYTKDDIPFVKTVANVIAASDKQAGRTGNDASGDGSGSGSGSGVQKWLLDALPNVGKQDRKRLKERGVESRRSGGQGALITSRSGYERRKENNRRGAIEGSKKRKTAMAIRVKDGGGDEDDGRNGVEWGGIDD